MNTVARNERGATAVMMALLSVVLLGISAVAVDVGQIYAKRSSLQSAADLAVLAAAPELDGSPHCTTAAKAAAERYLRENWIDAGGDPIEVNLGGAPDDGNGYLQCDGWHVKLWAPTARVDYGLARIVSTTTGVDVPAEAAAGIFSPDTAVMPAYAVSGCDSGPQTLLDPPSGHAGTYVPILPEPSPGTDVGKLGYIVPIQIALNQFSPLTIYGSTGSPRFTGTTYVAFSTEDGQHFEYRVGGSNPTITVSSNEIHLSEIPAEVRTLEKVWWIRISHDATNPTNWSPASMAKPLRVGNPLLECAGVSNSGNFGTLDFPHLNPSASGEPAIVWNMLTNLSYNLSTLQGTSGYCTPGSNGAIGVPNEGTNCVGAKTGFAGNPATAGLITGQYGLPGRLAGTPTAPGCDPNGTSSNWTTDPIRGRTYSVNDDVLTCFLTNNSTSVADISRLDYNGPPVLSSEIFKSPRFFLVPVLKIQPTNGSSNRYSIVDFRPAFVTGQQGAATRSNPGAMDSYTHNGLVIGSAGIDTLKVVFFSINALPATMAGGDLKEYLGVGTKVVALTD